MSTDQNRIVELKRKRAHFAAFGQHAKVSAVDSEIAALRRGDDKPKARKQRAAKPKARKQRAAKPDAEVETADADTSTVETASERSGSEKRD